MAGQAMSGSKPTCSGAFASTHYGHVRCGLLHSHQGLTNALNIMTVLLSDMNTW